MLTGEGMALGAYKISDPAERRQLDHVRKGEVLRSPFSDGKIGDLIDEARGGRIVTRAGERRPRGSCQIYLLDDIAALFC